MVEIRDFDIEPLEPNQIFGKQETECEVQRRVSPRFQQRRCSARLQRIADDKKPYYGTERKRLLDSPKNQVSKKRSKVVEEDAQLKNIESSEVDNSDKITFSEGDNSGKSTFSEEDDSGKSTGAMLKHTLRNYSKLHLRFYQEEEKRCNTKRNSDGSNNNNMRFCKRPDLKAISEMVNSNAILYPKKRLGHLPGVDVGHQFFSRAEMVAVGLHKHWLNGIDYIGRSHKMKEYSNLTLPVAVSIVLSGQYEDDVDNTEEVVYTGQGGNDLLGKKCQIKDQVMCRGNLALKNNMDQGVPVRVIRGYQRPSRTKTACKIYTYDGLYKVSQCRNEKGIAGYTIFKYRLKRLEGQPTLVANQVHFVRRHLSKGDSKFHGLVCKDISDGQEKICIPAINEFDVPPLAPSGFKYIKSIQVAKNVNIPPDAPGCNCKEYCTNATKCSCARLNGNDFPYVRRDGGRLVQSMDVVYECGPGCSCGPKCVNRTSQQGLKYQLEVYRTQNKGWAVRSSDFIPSGAPVCEYTGIVRKSDELDNVSANDFIFDIDCWQTMNGIEGRERRSCDGYIETSNQAKERDDKISESVPEFCIDAGSFGNVARFINHSCDPNLFVQCVLSSHRDVRLARVVLFAADNIVPMQELTYDYGYRLDSVVGPDGKIKKFPCYCGAAICRKRLY